MNDDVPQIELRDLTSDNWRQCIKLKVEPRQERFVASNIYSLAESKFEPWLVPQAIYHDDAMVGFTMYGRVPGEDHAWVMRLMVDQRYQGRGYGRAALLAVIERLRAEPGLREIRISYQPDNERAERLYLSLGFERTGERIEGEVVARLALHAVD